MTDFEYLQQAERLLQAVEQACDHLNDSGLADVDVQRAGGLLNLVLDNGSQIVINQQKPLHEMWLATQAGGFHFRFDGQDWLDTKGAGEFLACLSRLASEQAGQPLDFGVLDSV